MKIQEGGNIFKKLRLIRMLVITALAIAVLFPQALLAAGPKNVIFVIGDGLANAQRRAAEEILETKLVMNTLPVVGMYTTQCLDAIITDSAAAGTALATGNKTNSGVISMDPEGKMAYETVAEAAKRMGKSVGLISTMRITHATPATFGAHVSSRSEETKIAKQYLEQGFEVYMGGGISNFIPKSAKGSKRKDDLDLLKAFSDAGYDVLKSKDDLMKLSVSKDTKVLGLFTSSHMPFHLDRPENVPSLSEMTEMAIKVLSQNPKGFFLMVEGGKLDMACHANDPVATVANTAELDNAVQKAMDFRKQDADTLIFVGGDHETGGMGLGLGLDYFLKTDVIKNAKKTYEWVGNTYSKKGGDPVALMTEATGITDFSDAEIEAIKTAAANVTAKKKFANSYNRNWLAATYADILSKRSHVGWTTWAHTANPVMVTLIGPGSEAFGGYYDNVEPARKLSSLWGVSLKSWKME